MPGERGRVKMSQVKAGSDTVEIATADKSEESSKSDAFISFKSQCGDVLVEVVCKGSGWDLAEVLRMLIGVSNETAATESNQSDKLTP